MHRGDFKPKGSPIIMPARIGDDQLHLGRNLDGSFILTVNNQSIRLSPPQMQDFALKILRSLGFQLEEIPASDGLTLPPA